MFVLIPRPFLVILALAIALIGNSEARSAGDWRLEISDAEAGIKVYYRTTDKGYTEFRAVTSVRSTLGAFVALFRDVDNMPNWVYRTKEVRALKAPGGGEAHAYTIHEMPWPLNDRDSIVRSRLSQDPDTLAVTIKGSAVPDYLPRDSRYVRIPVVESFWRFTPVAEGLVEVEFQGYGDPGGNFSSGLLNWVMRLSLWEAPYETLLGLRRTIILPEYQSRTFAFVREPGRSH